MGKEICKSKRHSRSLLGSQMLARAWPWPASGPGELRPEQHSQELCQDRTGRPVVDLPRPEFIRPCNTGSPPLNHRLIFTFSQNFRVLSDDSRDSGFGQFLAVL